MLAAISFSTILFSTLALYSMAAVLIVNQGIVKMKKQGKITEEKIEVNDTQMNENAQRALSTKNVSQLLQKEQEKRVSILDILNEGREEDKKQEVVPDSPEPLVPEPKKVVSPEPEIKEEKPKEEKPPVKDFTQIFNDLKNKNNQ